ncbi:MAG: glycerophosphodiester phosphodiesterase [Castellaniella sp.]|uniref:glycerophosphodiester phosphodiesterase n=1 Tax=Castellaniella sp. TaxID=1955812 RepID=UPI002A36C6BF|nr:glycerophosphodiester phosphodiesterase [Castellaniella sp.]MDY0309185.1 glycerophosphodiester phosphodiesterase [Castellaniella sp.]
MPPTHSAWPWPAFIAHRGGGHLAPENTLAAIRAGAAAGFGMVEFDVKLSGDGMSFLLHDDSVDRTSDGHGLASTLDWRALGRMDFGSWHGPDFSGEPAPSLYAVARYTRAHGIHSNIEIKPTTGHDAETGAAVAHEAARLWAGASLPPLLSSFSETALEAARTAQPGLPRALLIEGPVPADWRARQLGLGCIGLNIDTEHADEATVRDILDQEATLAVWTVNDPARARTLLDWGCHAIFTDELDRVRADAPGLSR